MGIEEARKKHTELGFYRNNIVVQKGELIRLETKTIEEEVKKSEKLNHYSKRIKLLEYAMEHYIDKYRK